MNVSYFPGANTPMGFYHRFDTLLHDRRVHRRLYIKGGAGCGKSTLMRRLAELEEDSELGLCASDPASLDAVLLPRAGLAVCDATAPHVCEPSLCGADGLYLDLSRFYSPVPSRKLPALQGLQQAAKACYAPATHALQAVQALYRQRRSLVDTPELPERLHRAARLALQSRLEPGGTATTREVFLHAVTPVGCISRYTLLQPAQTTYLLHDSFHVAGLYLQQLRRLAQASGQSVIVGFSPLFPTGEPAQLYLPDAGVAFLRATSHFGTLPVGTPLDLDGLLPDTASRPDTLRLRELTQQLLTDAVSHLARAKALHDELEAALHPYVDFDAVAQLTHTLTEQVRRWQTE